MDFVAQMNGIKSHEKLGKLTVNTENARNKDKSDVRVRVGKCAYQCC